MSRFRTPEDLIRAIRTIAVHFRTDVVYVIGSQAIMLSQSTIPPSLSETPEIDLYPANNIEWEKSTGLEASEEINGLFGENSQFHEAFNFYIDGVDESTAKLPDGWFERAVSRSINVNGSAVVAIAPCADDLAVSKLCRFDPKDKKYVEKLHEFGWINIDTVIDRVAGIGLAHQQAKLIVSWLKHINDPEHDAEHESDPSPSPW